MAFASTFLVKAMPRKFSLDGEKRYRQKKKKFFIAHFEPRNGFLENIVAFLSLKTFIDWKRYLLFKMRKVSK